MGELSLYIRCIYPTQITNYSYFASGTGAAGVVGAFLWWEIRGLGVRIGVGLSSVRAISSVCDSSFNQLYIKGPTIRHSTDLSSTPTEPSSVLISYTSGN